MASAFSLETELETGVLGSLNLGKRLPGAPVGPKELSMKTVGSQRGESKIGCLFWAVAALLFAMVAVKVVPIKIASMKLEDHMHELATTQGKRGKDFFERGSAHNRNHSLNR